MPRWTAKRAARVRRRPDGTIREWTGGRTKAQLPKQENTAHGIATHIGQAFAREHGRRARTGDIYRWRRSDGRHHALAFWYVKTPAGWRKSPTGTRRPTAAQVRNIVNNARRGKPGRAGPG